MPDSTISIVFSHPPYGSELARAGIDAVMAYAAFDQKVQLIFIDDGCWLLAGGQNPSAGQGKNLAKMLSLFEMYGIDQCYALDQDLQQRQLGPHNTVIDVKAVDQSTLNQLMHSSRQVLTF